MNDKFCNHCGRELKNGDKFCAFCGKEVISKPAEAKTPAAGLFDKMESNVPDFGGERLANEEITVLRERERFEKERQEREIARAYLQKYNSLSTNYVLGFIGALLGGLVAAIPWAIVSSAGWFVAWLGYLIAIAASKGYDLMRVRVSMKKIYFVAVSVVIGVFAGQIMSDVISIAMDDELGGMTGMIFSYFVRNFGEYLSINASNLLLGLLFAALGGFSVLRDIKKENAVIEEMKLKYQDEKIYE